MTPIKKLLKPYKDSGSFSSVIPIKRFLNDQVFLTKSGALGIGLEPAGIDYECLTDEMLANHSARIYSALRPIGESFRLYQYVIKTGGAHIESGTGLDYRNEDIGENVWRRANFLMERGLYDIQLAWVLLYEPGVATKNWFSTQKAISSLSADLQRNIQQLTSRAEALCAELGGLAVMDSNDLWGLLWQLVNLDTDECMGFPGPLKHETSLDYFLTNETVAINPNGISVGRNHLEILSLKDAFRATASNLLRDLYKLPADFILCTEYKPVGNQQALKEIASTQNHQNISRWYRSAWTFVRMAMNRFLGDDEKEGVIPDAGAEDDINELDQLVKAINKGDTLVQFSTTLAFFGTDNVVLRRDASEAVRIFGQNEASLFRETYNAFHSYLSMLPGNTAFNHRLNWLLRSSYADLALIYKASQGDKRNTHLGQEYLLAVETTDGTPHYLNLHNQDVLGVFITGKTGSGKSVLSNTCLDHLQKYSPHTLILDVGGSYRQICRKYDGSMMNVGDLDFHANPFCIEASERTTRLISGFIRLLLSNENHHANHEERKEIFEAVGEIYTRDIEHRKLSNLKLNDNLKAALWRWTGRGEFGGIFDNTKDEITFSHFKVFDFAGIEQSPEIAEPLFFYLFMRHDAVVQDPAQRTRLKLLWVDEAHLYLANETCRKYFVKAGKTYRKHNAGIVLTTQSAFDLKNAGMFEVITEVTPTKVLLANPSADLQAYRELFHFNDAELDAFRKLQPKKQFMLKREEEPAQILNLSLSPEELELYRNDPFGNARREEAQKQHGEKWMEALTGGTK
jgi:type IV secretion system protein TrbE